MHTALDIAIVFILGASIGISVYRLFKQERDKSVAAFLEQRNARKNQDITAEFKIKGADLVAVSRLHNYRSARTS